VLARMRRGYTVDDYRRLIARIRELIPGVSIATDVIVGFPGETQEQFEHTYELLEELKLDKAHIARYSSRPLTVATRTFEDTLSHEEKERRRRRLDDLQEEILTRRNARYLDEEVEILVEGRHERRERWYGRTCRDRLVFFPSDDDWLGKMATVKITWAGPWSLVGEVVTGEG